MAGTGGCGDGEQHPAPRRTGPWSRPPSVGVAIRTTDVRDHTYAPRTRRMTRPGAPYTGRSVFDALSEKLQETLSDVRSHGTLTEDDINKAMREIRLALLEADVNFKVVKQFTATVKERCLGAEVVGQLNPGQQVVKIVHEELASLMGGA